MADIPFGFVAPATALYIVEAWGAGGGGQGGGTDGNAGGAGAYSRRAGISLTLAQLVTGATGVGGPPSNNGGDSQFGPFVFAEHGFGGVFGSGGAGGDAASGVGSVKFSGGKGGVSDGGILYGGGGGSSADDTGDGNVGGIPAGGAARPRGGGGGDGGTGAGVGSPGLAPGGGGGGRGQTAFNAGGRGADGSVVIWFDLGVWPPIGQTPVATYGAPVPPFPNPPNPKLRKSVSII